MEHERAAQNLAVECYLLGEMTPEEQQAFEAHYFDCPVCADDLRAASQFIEEARDIFASDPAPAPPIRHSVQQPGWSWVGWLRPQLAMAMIGILAAAVGLETLGTIPSLRRRLDDESAPRILAPTYLRPQTRGAPTMLTAVPGQPEVFIFDLPESAPPELHFVVRSADGRAMFRLSGRTSGPGEPVTLSIPRLELPSGIYKLVIDAAAANDQDGPELGQFPFEVKLK
ncbi:MAG TPA: zf-HC2 domain-containing protein [Bryobacteraceae bacterium]|jgi:hypothetical protein